MRVALLTGCADGGDTDPFQRILANDRSVTVLGSGGFTEVVRPREIREEPNADAYTVPDMDPVGALVGDTLWYSDGFGVGSLDSDGIPTDEYVTDERLLLDLQSDEFPFHSVTSVDSYGSVLWITFDPLFVSEEEAKAVPQQPSFLVSLDTATGSVQDRRVLDSPVLDAVVSGDRLILLTGPTFLGGGDPARIEIRRASDGSLITQTERGLDSAREFDRLSNGGPDIWLATALAKAVRRISPTTGTSDRVIAVPCTPEVVLAVTEGLVIPCTDRPTILLQRREGGDPNELPLPGGPAVDVQVAAGALWAVDDERRLVRIQARDLPWPE